MFDLSARVCIVTEAGGEIGQALAGTLADCGAPVAVMDIDGVAARTSTTSFFTALSIPVVRMM